MSSDALSIQDISDATGVTVHALRYYEKAGLMIDVPRRANGHRVYAEHHIRWVRFLCRLRSAGMSIEKVRRYAELTQQGDRTLSARAKLLENHRREVADEIRQLTEHLNTIDAKLERYRQRGIGCDSSE